MDSGRFLLAVVLMIAVMVVTNMLLPPPRPEVDGMAADSLSAPAADSGRAPADALPGQAPARTPGQAPGISASPSDPDAPAPPPPAPDVAGATDTVVVSSPTYRYRIATRGAAIIGAALLEHEALGQGRAGQPAELAPDSFPRLFSYGLRVGTRYIDLSTLDFQPATTGPVTVTPGTGPQTVELTHSGADGLGITVQYAFDPDNFLIGVRMAVTGAAQTPTLHIRLPHTLAYNEADTKEDERALAYVVNQTQRGINSGRLASVDQELTEEGPLLWAAVKNKYFVAAVLTHPEVQARFGGLIVRPVPQELAADLTTTLVPGSDGTYAFRIYAGPQEPQRLALLGDNFGDVNPFGWRLFRPMLRPLGHGIQWAIYGMHDLLGIGYGWVLILFGVLIRVLMWPLNAKAMRSQMKNMEIQPKLKDIQTRYKNEPEKLQKEMLRLYKEEGFNPMGGCLPMLVPMPILITLFFVFQSTIAFRGVEFLWLPDLSQKDPLYILPVLLGVSMYLMQWLSTRSMPDQNPQMKFMMYAMPPFMTIIFLNFASGLNLYYAAMNFASLPQQIQIMNERRRRANVVRAG